jgi:hypothetical protein
MNEFKTALPIAAAAYLGTRLASGFTKGKSAIWEVAGGILGAALGVVVAKKIV